MNKQPSSLSRKLYIKVYKNSTFFTKIVKSVCMKQDYNYFQKHNFCLC